MWPVNLEQNVKSLNAKGKCLNFIYLAEGHDEKLLSKLANQ
jgi:hypothetical protein